MDLPETIVPALTSTPTLNPNPHQVDLPETIDAKRCVHERYRDDVNPQVNLPTLVGMDLNDCEHSSLLAHLEASYGFNPKPHPHPHPQP